MICALIACPDCGAQMQLRPSRFGKFYGCTRWPDCDGTHGAHPDGRPLGIPATRETKDARIRAHAAFDQLWKSGKIKRHSAYGILQRLMGMTHEEAHIGRFTKEQCETLIDRLQTDGRLKSEGLA